MAADVVMDAERLGRFVDDVWDDSIVPTLEEYIRIPNKSPAFEPDWRRLGHMRAAVEHLEGWVAAFGVRGMTHRIFTLPGRTPVLLCEIEGSAPGNALLYGHYDKQPEFEGWAEGLAPWEPVIRDGRLYGRGGADDGYAVFGSLTAIAALQEQGIPHPRCLVLIEGCEESGSYDLPAYMDALADDIGTPDLVICLDAECGNYDQLWLTTSLRGMLPGTLTVEVLTEGVHSGAAGGIVPSSFRLLRRLIERVENAATGELVDVLHVQVPAAAHRQAEAVARTLGDLGTARFPWAGSTHPGKASPAELILANTWRPSLAVVGLGGAPDIADAGNTLRPYTAAKLVFRLPPTLDAEAAADRIKDILESDPPHGAEVAFDLDHPLTGWSAPDTAPWLATALDRGSRAHFGAPFKTMGTGGTIPFMKMLGDRFADVQFAVTGVLGPKSNAHGPNEFLDIATGKRVTACMAHVLAALP
ncbi:MAG: M20/M25/M40 family metallo-hydrolase [Pseudomonadales bacterium]|nr:M20/M25/M40 family metallo-hydrolase [Pseudomonadales bacterium]